MRVRHHRLPLVAAVPGGWALRRLDGPAGRRRDAQGQVRSVKLLQGNPPLRLIRLGGRCALGIAGRAARRLRAGARLTVTGLAATPAATPATAAAPLGCVCFRRVERPQVVAGPEQREQKA